MRPVNPAVDDSDSDSFSKVPSVLKLVHAHPASEVSASNESGERNSHDVRGELVLRSVQRCKSRARNDLRVDLRRGVTTNRPDLLDVLRRKDFGEVVRVREGDGDAVEERRSRLPAVRNVDVDSSAGKRNVEVVVRLEKQVVSSAVSRTAQRSTLLTSSERPAILEAGASCTMYLPLTKLLCAELGRRVTAVEAPTKERETRAPAKK